MSGGERIADFLAERIGDAETSWSLGTFGAIAEFAREPDEPAKISCRRGLTAVTERGGVRIKPRKGLRLVAFESTTKESWNHRIALCLPADACAMNQRTVLTELGPDRDALRPQDREAILFDLGVGALHTDACVRVADPEVAAGLRAHCDQPLFAAGNPAVGVLLAASPHRVFVSRIGRIEVYQPIPPHGGKSPEGPHTHVLPALLAKRRTHAATEQLPDGFVPCAHLYPGHPARDAMGRRRPFDRSRHEAFQDMLRRFGDPQSVALKERVLKAVTAGDDPSVIPTNDNRFTRTNIRVALRQIKAGHGDLPTLAAWFAAHETREQRSQA